MSRLLRSTRQRFVALIMTMLVLTIGVTFFVLQVINVLSIGSNADMAEVRKAAEKHSALNQYIDEQAGFEAHFVTLASAIKDAEEDRVTIALLATSITVLIFGSIAAYLIAQRLMKPVEEAYLSQERFLQDAAHELRNPLAALSAALQEAERKGTGPELLQTFKRQTKRLVSINEDLLFIERQQYQNSSLINISDLLEEILEDMQSVILKKRMVLDLQIEPNVYRTLVPSDYVRLMKNIIDNAIKYSPVGSSVRIVQAQTKHGVKIIVQDKGIGIPKKELEHIGERFYRAKNVGKVEGTGLGFAIVKKILNSYGGTLDIESTLGKGTTITISLP